MENIGRAVSLLRERLGPSLREVMEFRGETTVVLEGEAVVQACRALRDDPGLQFNLLADLTAVDYWPKEPRFAVVYQLGSLPNNLNLRLRVLLGGKLPVLPTLTPVYPSANWLEREIFDMFGIRFDGHPDLRRILMPADWEGHPLRKDYPLGYEEVQFSFNFDEIGRKKPYAKE